MNCFFLTWTCFFINFIFFIFDGHFFLAFTHFFPVIRYLALSHSSLLFYCRFFHQSRKKERFKVIIEMCTQTYVNILLSARSNFFSLVSFCLVSIYLFRSIFYCARWSYNIQSYATKRMRVWTGHICSSQVAYQRNIYKEVQTKSNKIR